MGLIGLGWDRFEFSPIFWSNYFLESRSELIITPKNDWIKFDQPDIYII